MAYVFDLDDTLTSENCLEEGSELERRVHAFLDSIAVQRAKVFVVTSRMGHAGQERDIFTYGLGPGTVSRLIRALGARTMAEALWLNEDPATRWLFYINDRRGRVNELRRLGEFLRVYPDTPLFHGGIIKMLQLMDIQVQTGLPFRDIHFFDDADHNYEAWRAFRSVTGRTRRGMVTAMGDMNFHWGRGRCVFLSERVWKRLDDLAV